VLNSYFDLEFYTERLSRPLSILLRDSLQADAYSVYTVSPEFNSKPEAVKANVVSIVLNELPTPSESVSWEQILEFRSDPDTAGRFLGLRNWMNELARARLSSPEIEEKLEWLMYEYQKHLELHKMKVETSTLETLVVSTAECLENLIKLNIGKAAKGFFSLKHRKLALLEGELNSPGSEIAYIVKARQTFLSSSSL